MPAVRCWKGRLQRGVIRQQVRKCENIRHNSGNANGRFRVRRIFCVYENTFLQFERNALAGRL